MLFRHGLNKIVLLQQQDDKVNSNCDLKRMVFIKTTIAKENAFVKNSCC